MILSDPIMIEKQEQEALGLARHLGEMMAVLPESSLQTLSPFVADEMVKSFAKERVKKNLLN